MDRNLVKAFWNCGDTAIIDFAIHRARLNKNEKDVVECLLDECMTQEKTAEFLQISPRCVQDRWKTAADKLLTIPWLVAYAKELDETCCRNSNTVL